MAMLSVKNRLITTTIIGIFCLIVGFASIFSLIKFVIQGKGLYIPNLVFAIMQILGGIGVLRLKNLGRNIIIGLAAITIIMTGFSVLLEVIFALRLQEKINVVTIIVNLTVMGIYIGIIYHLSRQKIKAYFR